ncbi:hypothetical protein ENUP19_0052G0044 [Entamoeba nuttalli]|uniref:Stress-associated endoplasmic reticulum protein n=1 Tax=Entamoeba nuttalli TaxID=412467 RepID=A0ABQ0DBZ5_9EUKA
MSGAQAHLNAQNKKFVSGIKPAKKEEKAAVGPVVLAIFLFVVVGSAVISLFRVM